MPDTESSEQMVWWAVRPEEPTKTRRLLESLKLVKTKRVSVDSERIPISDIEFIADEGLRRALGRQVASFSTDHLVVPVAYPDGRLSHVNTVMRRSLNLPPAPNMYEDN